MAKPRVEQLLPWGGAVAGVGWVLGNFAPTIERAGDPAILEALAGGDTRLLIAQGGYALMSIRLVVLSVAARARLRAGEDEESTYSGLAYAGFLVAASAALARLALIQVAAAAADNDDRAVAHVWSYLDYYAWWPILIGVSTAILACGVGGARTHVSVLADAIDQLPDAWAAGHRHGDNTDLAEQGLLVRADSGGASHWLAEEIRLRNAENAIGYAIDQCVRDGICCIQHEDWVPAVDSNGEPRAGAEVVELTDYVNLDAWPDRTRLIVRRERPHPGAQLTLFDTIEGMRYTAFITDTAGSDIASLELRQRQRARAENVIRDTKACGLANLPFDCIINNDIWMRLCFAANDPLCWARRIGCQGNLAKATPKTIRRRLLSVAGAITPTGRRLHLDTRWPWTTQLLDAIHCVRTAFASLTVNTTAASPAAQ